MLILLRYWSGVTASVHHATTREELTTSVIGPNRKVRRWTTLGQTFFGDADGGPTYEIVDESDKERWDNVVYLHKLTDQILFPDTLGEEEENQILFG